MAACPLCGKEIQADAIKCKHCKRFLVNEIRLPHIFDGWRAHPFIHLSAALVVIGGVGLGLLSHQTSLREEETEKTTLRLIEQKHAQAAETLRRLKIQYLKTNWDQILSTGKTLLQQKKYAQALSQFNQLSEVYPNLEELKKLVQAAKEGIEQDKQDELARRAKLAAQQEEQGKQEALQVKRAEKEILALASEFAKENRCPAEILTETIEHGSLVPVIVPCYEGGSTGDIEWLNTEKTKAQVALVRHCECMTGYSRLRGEPRYATRDYDGGKITCEKTSSGNWRRVRVKH